MRSRREIKKLANRSDAQKVERMGGEEDRECNGRTTLRYIWREWEKNGEYQQKIEIRDCW